MFTLLTDPSYNLGQNKQSIYSPLPFQTNVTIVRGGADKSLAPPGRKQATATKLGIYSTHSPQSSIHFLANCSNFWKPLKKKFRRLSVQPGLHSRNDLVVAPKMATFQLSFSAQGTGLGRRSQIRRIGWVIKTLEAQIGSFFLVASGWWAGALSCKNRTLWWPYRFVGVFPWRCPSIAPAETSDTPRW